MFSPVHARPSPCNRWLQRIHLPFILPYGRPFRQETLAQARHDCLDVVRLNRCRALLSLYLRSGQTIVS